mmetsp:Transcript_25486/g.40759  ORF Transcript_25486/g.40759 Transcript_25486/m.40759 type:complete len:228 (+) Transcript_25486:131-814(+)
MFYYLLVEGTREAGAVRGEAVCVELATKLDGGRVDVLANGAHVVVDAHATLVDLLGVHAILGVQVLHLTRGEHSVHTSVDLVLRAHGVEQRQALLLARQLEQVRALTHNRRAASRHLEDHLLGRLPGQHVELLNLGLAKQPTGAASEDGRGGVGVELGRAPWRGLGLLLLHGGRGGRGLRGVDVGSAYGEAGPGRGDLFAGESRAQRRGGRDAHGGALGLEQRGGHR